MLVVAVLVCALLLAVFAVQNASPVDIRLFFWTFGGIPLVLVILGTALCGVVLGLLLGYHAQRKKGREAGVRLRLPK